MSVVITPYLPSTRVAIGQGQTWSVEIRNNSDTGLPVSRLHVLCDSYNSASSCVVPAIAPWGTVKVTITSHIDSHKSIEDITGCVTWKYNDVKRQTVDRMERYMGKLKAFAPPTGSVAKYKLCLFGLAGAGKSAFINAVLTLASSGMSVVETAGVGGCARHNTRQLATYTIDGENFALVDTWGLTLTTYLNDDLENVVDGVFPRNWGMDMIYDQHAKAIRDHASTRRERALHVILFMITHSALDKNDECELIKANYARLQNKAARNPLVLISKVDEIVPAFRSNPLGNYPEVRALKQKVTDLLGIPENRVYAVVNYTDESERSFQIDRNTYRIVEHALRTASENLRRVAEEPPTTFEW